MSAEILLAHVWQYNRAEAMAFVARALKIEDPAWAEEAGPDDVTWRRMNDAQKLAAMGDILKSHCMNLIESHCNTLVTTDRIPMNTVGTND